ncbi:MAG: hypothetical protein JXA92_10470 [candidate division Zixibacteria bacterium]|nr:hypothetical protein [candidate division Zixibacteria bacterium]
MKKTEFKLELIDYRNDDGDESGATLRNKFVIMTHRDIAALVMGPVTRYPYHAALLERYCIDNKIPASWAHKPDLLEIFDREVQLKGGGLLDIYPQDKILKIYGFSSAYGPYSSDYLKKFINGHPFFTPFSVRVKVL